MADHIKAGSFFDQVEDFAHDQELVGPILKEAREDRAEIKKLRAENDHLHSVLKSLLSCAEHWYRTANPTWDGSAKPWSAIGMARALTERSILPSHQTRER